MGYFTPSNFNLQLLRGLSLWYYWPPIKVVPEGWTITAQPSGTTLPPRVYTEKDIVKHQPASSFLCSFFYQINRYLKKLVTSNHKSRASLSPNWCHFCLPRKNVLIFPRKFALEAGKTLERSKNQSSRSGVMSLLKNQDWPKI